MGARPCTEEAEVLQRWDEGVPECSHPATALLDRRGASGLRFSGTLRKIVILGHLALVLAGFWE